MLAFISKICSAFKMFGLLIFHLINRLKKLSTHFFFFFVIIHDFKYRMWCWKFRLKRSCLICQISLRTMTFQGFLHHKLFSFGISMTIPDVVVRRSLRQCQERLLSNGNNTCCPDSCNWHYNPTRDLWNPVMTRCLCKKCMRIWNRGRNDYCYVCF